MNPQQLQQQIALSYSKLPPDVQQIFSSMKWMDTLKNISIKHGLKDDQIETLGTETTLAFLGIIHPDEYETNLANELNMQNDALEKLLVEINDLILKPIRPQLAQAHDNHAISLVEERYGSTEKLDERFEKLPKEVQEAIGESNYQSVLYAIATEKKLSIDQMGLLEEVTNKVLLGITHPDKYESELKEKLGLSTDKITEIVNAVNEGILKNIREILKSHWDKGEGGIKNIDDDVPLPPYAKMFTASVIEPVVSIPIKEEIIVPPPTPLSKVESGIYGNAGIEVVEEVTKEEDLAHSIIASKLSTMTKTEPVVSDHSMPKMTQPTLTPVPPSAIPSSTKPAHDPYKEVIE